MVCPNRLQYKSAFALLAKQIDILHVDVLESGPKNTRQTIQVDALEVTHRFDQWNATKINWYDFKSDLV